MNKSLSVVYSNIMFHVAKANIIRQEHRGSKGIEGDVRVVPGDQGGRQECHRGSSQTSMGPRVQGGGQGCARGSRGTKEIKGEFRGVSEGTSREVPRVEWGGLRGRGGLDM